MEPVDVFLHHSRFGNARPDNGTGSHQGEIIVAVKLFKQAAHGGTFDIKTADGLAAVEPVVYLFILLKIGNAVNIHLYSPVPGNDFNTFIDVPDSALTENIQFFKTDRLGYIHVELGCLESFGRHVECRVAGNGFFGYQDAAGMNASEVGKIKQLISDLKKLFRNIIPRDGCRIIHQAVNFFFRKAVGLSKFAEDGTVPEGAHRAQEGRMLASVAFKNIVLHLIPVFPGIIDVEVGRRSAFRIDEAFKIQVQLNGINIGDFQAIGHNAVGAAAASHMVKAAAHGIPDNIPGDEKISGKSQFINYFKFMFHAADGFCIGISIAVLHSVEGQFLKQLLVVVPAACKCALILNCAEVHFHGAFIEHLFRILGNLRVIGIDDPGEIRRKKDLFGGGQVVGRKFAEQCVFADGTKMAMQYKFIRNVKGHRQQGQQFLLVVAEPRRHQPVDISRPDADEFIFQRLNGSAAGERINCVCIVKSRAHGEARGASPGYAG